MKKIFLLLVASAFIFISCSDEWDKHYNSNVDNEDVSTQTLKEYFDNESSYSQFYDLLKSAKFADEMSKNQYLTVFAVKNENYDDSEYENLSDSLLGGYHICNLAFGQTELKQGLRIMCMNGIYVTISQEGDDFYANGQKILSSKRFKNGVVHEIPELMRPLTNMFAYVETLGDDYSIIRDSILSYNVRMFDRVNSTPVSVDKSGNIVYDSVFYYTNPMFDKADISSEFKQFTMFLPSNQVIEDCYAAMQNAYGAMGTDYTQADTLLAINWIKGAIFHNGLVSDYHEAVDLKSAAGQVWRTTVQEVDEVNTDELSNGVVYKVTKMKIPNNLYLKRMKSLVHYYEYLTEEERASLYIFKGLDTARSDGGIEIFKGDGTPANTPIQFYYLLKLTGIADSSDEFSAEFPPISYNAATGEAAVMKVPPGEYDLYMGFRSSDHAFVDISFHSGNDPMPDDWPVLKAELQVQASNPWNYDRNNVTSEYSGGIGKWNGHGGKVGTVNLEGDGLETFHIKVKFNKLYSTTAAKTLQIYHWALLPTANNY
ncbi:fasciclin domain-containing protein [Viscerimonas tarda]